MDLMLEAARLAWTATELDEVYIELLEQATESCFDLDLPFDVPYVHSIRAHLAHARGADDVPMWRRAVESWTRVSSPYRAAETTLDLANALVREGDRDAAAEAMRTALHAAESLGARPLVDEFLSLAARARLPLSGNDILARGGDTRPLTAREYEVLQLLVTGATNQQIGTTLFMSPRTASVHVSHILDKLGATNRTEVATIAHQRGLLAE